MRISGGSSRPFSSMVGPAFVGVFLLTLAGNLFAQDALRVPTPAPSPSPALTRYRSPTELKKLPIEQLVDVEITSAARRAEPLSQASSAIDVITADDVRRAGVTNLPDALRLGTEVEVAQIDGHDWAISTRGFSASTANKLQVLMDGRNLYTPLFSGVFWDVQQVFLPDLEQIEIIRGPGATLWGANAVNGVINIRTKSADQTQGTLVYGGGGNEETGFGGIRYGGMVGANTAYRVYVMHQSRDSLTFANGADAQDDYHITQGGFRIDSKVHPEDTVTLQGDVYSGDFGQFGSRDSEVDGQNLIGRWTRQLGSRDSLSLQAYFDRTHRFIPNLFEETRETYDLELQHQLTFGEQDIVYGANYRASHDDIGNISAVLAFLPPEETEHLVSAYAQDTWHIVPDVFSITAGSKFEYNTFSGFEVQPTGRFTWRPGEGQTVWGAISRAVRTPSRIDEDFVAPNPATGQPVAIFGTEDFETEVLVAYELGYRIKPAERLSFDLAAFYNDYDQLRSVEPQPDRTFQIENLLNARSFGGAISTQWHPFDWWKLDGSVSLLQLQFQREPGSRGSTSGAGEANDPNASFILHSALDLPRHVQFDSFLRFVNDLPHPETPSYVEMDLRLSWSPFKDFEIAIVGRNLLHESHPEFADSRPALTVEVPRSVYGTLRWSF